MAKKILINATFPEETRVAIVLDDELLDFDIQSQEYFRTKSNIYKGVVTRLEPGLEAVFVNYGEERNGFLPVKEIIPQYFNESYPQTRNLHNLMEIGQELVVQVDKEARKDKGAALTTRITMAGRFMVLMRGAPRTHSVSRRSYGTKRLETERISKQLEVPQEFGIIIRTAGVGRTKGDLVWDLNYLSQLWGKIEEKSKSGPAPFLILQESDVITRTLRDHLYDDAVQVIADTQKAYDSAKAIISHAVPDATNMLELYNSSVPLFTHYDIERQIQTAFQQVVKLPSGGQLVFDRTEAMFIIDVNSSQATQGLDVEDTALTNNLEAVTEIARQMKIRDIGGLAVVDFIDMMDQRNKKKVEDAFRREAYKDRARIRLGKISRFGMIELSRQRLRSSLDEFYLHKCPQCNGVGTIRTDAALAIQLHRLLWDTVQNSSIQKVTAEVPESVYKILFSRSGENSVEEMTKEYKNKLSISSNPALKSPHFIVTSTSQNGKESIINTLEESENDYSYHSQREREKKRDPLLTTQEIFSRVQPRRISLAEKILDWLRRLFKPSPPPKKHQPRRGRYRRNSQLRQNRHRRPPRSQQNNKRYSSKPRNYNRRP